MRTDFVLTPAAGQPPAATPLLPPPPPRRKMVLEVKMVVDSDYPAAATPHRSQCVYVSRETPYRRAGIFPWANKPTQKGPDGEKVVSARAIKHVDELARLARGEATDEAHGGRLDAAVLFVLLRHDCAVFKPNREACPSFVRHLAAARDAGVRVVALRVRWGEGEDEGKAFADGTVPVVFGAGRPTE